MPNARQLVWTYCHTIVTLSANAKLYFQHSNMQMIFLIIKFMAFPKQIVSQTFFRSKIERSRSQSKLDKPISFWEDVYPISFAPVMRSWLIVHSKTTLAFSLAITLSVLAMNKPYKSTQPEPSNKQGWIKRYTAKQHSFRITHNAPNPLLFDTIFLLFNFQLMRDNH